MVRRVLAWKGDWSSNGGEQTWTSLQAVNKEIESRLEQLRERVARDDVDTNGDSEGLQKNFRKVRPC